MRIPIRLKLAAALAIPLIALAGVAAFEVAKADARAEEAANETALATAAVGPGSVISQLQEERNFTLVELLGMTGSLQLQVSSYDEARSNTDAATADLRRFVANRGGEVAKAFEAGLAAVDTDLTQLRADVDNSTAPRGLTNVEFAQGVYVRFAQLIDVLIDDTAGIALDVENADLRTGVELISFATLDLENSAEISRGIFSQILSGGSIDDARLAVAEFLSTFNVNRDKILDRSTGPYEGLPEEFLLTDVNFEQLAQYQGFVDTGQANMDALTAALSSDETPGIVRLRAAVAEVLQREAATIVQDANDQRQAAMTLGVLLVASALLITILASRSITNPLSSLTEQAETMATETLPNAVQDVLDTPLGEDVVVPEVPPIVVHTRDEVADVAEALNTVQASALDLAVEQAALRKNISDSFVNLGRRNQNLLDRQLELITDLESQEQEPERLEGLFRLDHLATRMRRHAESLLRLAGGGSDGSGGWGGPVPVVDVVRGALGEVEGYQRVDVRSLPAATIAGTAGADLAHALAELVENALQFSPPEERVEIRGRRLGDGGYTLVVIDQGVGMSDDQLESANRRLAGQESFTVAPSRYLGHYVAGYLGATHGIAISLAQEAAGGLTARLDIPTALVGEAEAPTLSAPTPVVEPEPLVEEVVEDPFVPVEDGALVDALGEETLEAVEELEFQEFEVVDALDVQEFEAVDALDVQEFEAVDALDVQEFDVVEPFDIPGPDVEDLDVQELDVQEFEVVEELDVDEVPPAEPEVAAAVEAPEPIVPIEPAIWTDADRPPVVREPAASRLAHPAGSHTANGHTSGGLARRVRGANAPSATNVASAFGGGEAAAPVADSSADAVASFLSAFSGGVERGLTETQREEEEQ